MNSNRTMLMGKGFVTIILGAEIIMGNRIVDCIKIFCVPLFKKYHRQNGENRNLRKISSIYQVKGLILLNKAKACINELGDDLSPSSFPTLMW